MVERVFLDYLIKDGLGMDDPKIEFLRRETSNEFTDGFISVDLKINDKEYNLMIWDTLTYRFEES